MDKTYPALLSQVAQRFQSLISLGSHSKDLLEYQDCFLGKEGVETLMTILKTKDRNVCILIGRALDAQGFFHDVSWTSRLRDSGNELYQFAKSDEDGNIPLPNGVFTLMADCYSPTCSRAKPCYSVTCPRRFDEKLLTSPSSHPSFASSRPTEKRPAELWSTSVSSEILEKVSKNELGRQEVIFEIISTEKEFVKDLENTIKHYVEPLRTRNIIPGERRERFIKQVFSNINELCIINTKLLKKLISRQKENDIVDKIGDIFVNMTHEFFPYVEYGAQQVYAKNILDDEKQGNPEFCKFLKETEKIPEFRKLPIESFLARATTRLGRYPLLLKPVMEKGMCLINESDGQSSR